MKIFDQPTDIWNWIYSVVGDIAGKAILLAFCKSKLQKFPSQQLAKTVQWLEWRFERTVVNNLNKGQHSLLSNASDTAKIIALYQKDIGIIEQHHTPDNEVLDPLLRFGDKKGVRKSHIG